MPRSPKKKMAIPEDGDPNMDYDEEYWTSRENSEEMPRFIVTYKGGESITVETETLDKARIHGARFGTVSSVSPFHEEQIEEFFPPSRTREHLNLAPLNDPILYADGIFKVITSKQGSRRWKRVEDDPSLSKYHDHYNVPKQDESGNYRGICIGGPAAGQEYACSTTHFEYDPQIINKDATTLSELGPFPAPISREAVRYEFMYLDGNGIWAPEGFTMNRVREVLIESYVLHVKLHGYGEKV